MGDDRDADSAGPGASPGGAAPDRFGITRRSFVGTLGAAAGGAVSLPLFSGDWAAVHQQRPVRVGVLLPYSGIYAVLGESITQGMELYFDQHGWESGGREIELVQEDSEMSTRTAFSRARRLVERENVDLLAGFVSSSVLLAVRSYLHSRRTLSLVTNAGAPELSRGDRSPYIWRTSFTNWQPAHPMGTWAARNVGTRGYISVHDYAAGHDAMTAMAHGFTQAGGEIVGHQQLPFPDIGDPAPYMADIRQADPDVVMVFYAGNAAVRFVNAYDQFGLKDQVPLTGSGFYSTEDVMPSQGSSAVGNISGLHWAYGLQTPENEAFKEEFRAHAGRSANVYAVQGYDTARVIAEMLATLDGDVSDVQQMIDFLPSVSFTSPRGPFSIDENSQSPRHNIYIREARSVGEEYHNVVREDTGQVVDPGDDSQELDPR